MCPLSTSRSSDSDGFGVRAEGDDAKADAAGGTPTVLSSAEREELSQLRKENRQLRLEREILKNAAAFFAKEPATRSR